MRFRVTIDGKAHGPDAGFDVDGNGIGTVTNQPLYQLVRHKRSIADRTFEIEFLDADAKPFVFTFG